MWATFASTDSNCQLTSDQNDAIMGGFGTVTLSRVDPTVIEGSFDVVMYSGAHLVGTFRAPICNVTFHTSGCDQ